MHTIQIIKDFVDYILPIFTILPFLLSSLVIFHLWRKENSIEKGIYLPIAYQISKDCECKHGVIYIR